MAHIRKLGMGDATTEYYMPYAMKTIVDRALPDVRDGLKPIHRRILYKMHEIGLHHNKQKMKSHPLVGRVLEIHGHGDSSVYGALAMLTNQNESLLHPFIDGEGSFGKVYATDKPSASRYTYARLNKFAEDMFKDLDKNIITFIGDDYKQPIVLPNTFPNALIKPNNGLAVGFACNSPSFNLIEVCDSAIAYIEDGNVDLVPLLNIDFPTGGSLIYDKKEIQKIYETGKGSVTIRAKYRVDGKYIEIYEIPYNTTANAIIEKVNKILLENNMLKEIIDIRDESEFNVETDREELKLVVEMKKNTDADLLMAKLYKMTPLENPFPCNMNFLVGNKPKTLGVKGVLAEWLKFRRECIIASLVYDITKKSAKLHELRGLEKVALDIDNTISIIRHTEKDSDVIPNLMKRLEIDEIQAQFVSEIRLRNLNKEYLIKKTKEIGRFEKEIEELQNTSKTPESMDSIIIKELQSVKSEHGKPRVTEILYEDVMPSFNETINEVEDYNVKLFVTESGYLKKIPLTSLRGAFTIKVKDSDKVERMIETTNASDILVYTNKQNVYKLKTHELEDCRPSVLGDYLPSLLKLQDEEILYVTATTDYKGDLLIGYDDGKVARISMKAYETKQNRSMLKNAYADKQALYFHHTTEDVDVLAISSIDKALVFNTSMINSKTSKTTLGAQAMKSKKDSHVVAYHTLSLPYEEADYYRTTSAGIGKYLKQGDFSDILGGQETLNLD